MLGLLGGAILGEAIGPGLAVGSEVGAILCGLAGLASTYAGVTVIDRYIRRRRGGGVRIIATRQGPAP